MTVIAPPGLWACVKVEVRKSNLDPQIPRKRGMPVSWPQRYSMATVADK